ncbi:MAG: AAA family ATPase [Candidatus Nanohaloarchaeota archaeon]|nr:AAA family ATPase [Candidatus Nanohaloarchaeota archaeon]
MSAIIQELFEEKGLLHGVLHGIYGKAGTGKTTFAMHITSYYLNQGKDVVVLDTEHGFFIERLLQIHRKQEDLQHVHIKKVMELHELRSSISKLKDFIKEKQLDLGAVIIDSLSNPYRVELKDQSNIWEINKAMSHGIFSLKKLALNLKIPVIATHQVYTDFETGEVEIVGRDLVKYDFKVMVSIEKKDNYRVLELVRHPFKKPRKVEAVIEEEGFKKKSFKIF